MSAVVIEGPLTKRSPGVLRMSLSRWQRRWWRLHRDCLVYHRDSKDTRSTTMTHVPRAMTGGQWASAASPRRDAGGGGDASDSSDDDRLPDDSLAAPGRPLGCILLPLIVRVDTADSVAAAVAPHRQAAGADGSSGGSAASLEALGAPCMDEREMHILVSAGGGCGAESNGSCGGGDSAAPSERGEGGGTMHEARRVFRLRAPSAELRRIWVAAIERQRRRFLRQMVCAEDGNRCSGGSSSGSGSQRSVPAALHEYRLSYVARGGGDGFGVGDEDEGEDEDADAAFLRRRGLPSSPSVASTAAVAAVRVMDERALASGSRATTATAAAAAAAASVRDRSTKKSVRKFWKAKSGRRRSSADGEARGSTDGGGDTGAGVAAEPGVGAEMEASGGGRGGGAAAAAIQQMRRSSLTRLMAATAAIKAAATVNFAADALAEATAVSPGLVAGGHHAAVASAARNRTSISLHGRSPRGSPPKHPLAAFSVPPSSCSSQARQTTSPSPTSRRALSPAGRGGEGDCSDDRGDDGRERMANDAPPAAPVPTRQRHRRQGSVVARILDKGKRMLLAGKGRVRGREERDDADATPDPASKVAAVAVAVPAPGPAPGLEQEPGRRLPAPIRGQTAGAPALSPHADGSADDAAGATPVRRQRARTRTRARRHGPRRVRRRGATRRGRGGSAPDSGADAEPVASPAFLGPPTTSPSASPPRSATRASARPGRSAWTPKSVALPFADDEAIFGASVAGSATESQNEVSYEGAQSSKRRDGSGDDGGGSGGSGCGGARAGVAPHRLTWPSSMHGSAGDDSLRATLGIASSAGRWQKQHPQAFDASDAGANGATDARVAALEAELREVRALLQSQAAVQAGAVVEGDHPPSNSNNIGGISTALILRYRRALGNTAALVSQQRRRRLRQLEVAAALAEAEAEAEAARAGLAAARRRLHRRQEQRLCDASAGLGGSDSGDSSDDVGDNARLTRACDAAAAVAAAADDTAEAMRCEERLLRQAQLQQRRRAAAARREVDACVAASLTQTVSAEDSAAARGATSLVEWEWLDVGGDGRGDAGGDDHAGGDRCGDGDDAVWRLYPAPLAQQLEAIWLARRARSASLPAESAVGAEAVADGEATAAEVEAAVAAAARRRVRFRDAQPPHWAFSIGPSGDAAGAEDELWTQRAGTPADADGDGGDSGSGAGVPHSAPGPQSVPVRRRARVIAA